MNLNKIECRDSAQKDLIRWFKEEKWVDLIPWKSAYGGRHLIAQHKVIGGKWRRYYIVYKREWRRTFSKYFPEFVKQFPEMCDCSEFDELPDLRMRGDGDCINIEALQIAKKEKCVEIIFVHPDGFYYYNTQALETFCDKFDLVDTQIKPSNVRKLGGGWDSVNERTYVFPRKLLQFLGRSETKATYKDLPVV